MGSVADEMTIVSIPLAATCLGAIFEPLGSLTGKAVAPRLKLVVRVHPWRQAKLKFVPTPFYSPSQGQNRLGR